MLLNCLQSLNFSSSIEISSINCGITRTQQVFTLMGEKITHFKNGIFKIVFFILCSTNCFSGVMVYAAFFVENWDN